MKNDIVNLLLDNVKNLLKKINIGQCFGDSRITLKLNEGTLGLHCNFSICLNIFELINKHIYPMPLC